MENPNCCFMIIAVAFFSPANRRGELWVICYSYLCSQWGHQINCSIFLLPSLCRVCIVHIQHCFDITTKNRSDLGLKKSGKALDQITGCSSSSINVRAWKKLEYSNELVGSNYQTTSSESTNFLTNIYYEFFFERQSKSKKYFGPIKSFFSFSTAKLKWGEGGTRFIVWWFDLMSSQYKSNKLQLRGDSFGPWLFVIL